MNSSLEKELYRATVRTFEELGFILPNADLAEAQRLAPVDGVVEVAFHGSLEGTLVLAVGGGILPAVVANMLGETEEIPLEEQRDALGELANVICGNVLPGIAGQRETFELSAPRTAAAASRSSSPAAEVHVGLSHGRADVLLYLEGKRKEAA